jgi:membrane-bound lytic murein transglycosylase D
MENKTYYKFFILFLILFVLQFIYFEMYQMHNTEKVMRNIDSISEKLDKVEHNVYSAERRSYVNIHEVPFPVIFCGDTLDGHDPIIKEKIEREFYSLLGNQGQIQLYLKRTKKYFPMIERYLRESALPEDLKYLAVHESALLPRIRSRSNAVGLWQIMRATGRFYKLKINGYIDERKDPEKATAAAMRIIRDLHKYFKRWPLALAAYNGGQGRIKRSMESQRAETFFDLSLAQETERYYFKIVATKIIISQPEKFGFKIMESDLFPAENLEALQVSINEKSMTIEKIADLCNLSIAELKNFNPFLISSYLPRGEYKLNIPPTNYISFRKNYVLYEAKKLESGYKSVEESTSE